MIIESDKVTLGRPSCEAIIITDPEVTRFFNELEHFSKSECTSIRLLFDEHIDDFDIWNEPNGDKTYKFTFNDGIESELKISYSQSRGFWSVDNLQSACFDILNYEEAAKLVVVYKLL